MEAILTTIIASIAHVFMFVNIMFICDTIWDCKDAKASILKVLAFSSLCFSSVILAFFNNYRYQDFYYVLAMPIYYLALFAAVKVFVKVKTSRVVYILLLIISVDSLLGSSVLILFDAIKYEMFDDKLTCAIISLSFNLLCITLMRLYNNKRGFNKFRKSIDLIPISIYVSILVISFLMGGLISVQAAETDAYELKLTFSQIFTILITPSLVVVLIILLINSVSRKYYENISRLLENQVKRQIKYYEQLEEKNNDLRAFKHDYQNHIQCIKYTLESDSTEDALEYIESLNYSFEETQKKFNTGNYIADALFDEKNIICENAGITFKHTGAIPITYIKVVDLCILLFNLLDNAIEACSKITDGEKSIKSFSDYKSNHLNILITNTVSEPVKILNNYILSTKSDKSNHGFGLMNIQRIVKKYDGRMKMTCENNVFLTEITFYAPMKSEE
jgi:sensor histidine kinase YesM